MTTAAASSSSPGASGRTRSRCWRRPPPSSCRPRSAWTPSSRAPCRRRARAGRRGEAGWDGPAAPEAVAGSDTYLTQSANLPSQARLAARQLAQATLGRPRFDFSGGMDADAERRSERCRCGSRVTHTVGRDDRRLGIVFRCPGRLAGVRDGGRASHLSFFRALNTAPRKSDLKTLPAARAQRRHV